MSRHTADVVVIGAGILGAAAAHYLSRAGQRVVVFDRGAPNREGSGTTAGNLHIQAIHPSRPGQEVPADNGRFLPLQVAVSDMWESVELELEASVELRRHGGFMIAETPHEYAELRAKQAMEAAAGLPTELLDGDAARAALPLLSRTVVGATWCALDGYANPLKITPAYLASARRHGAQIHGYTPVTGIAATRSGWRVTAGGDTYDAPAVINVAGPWIAQVARLAGIRLRMTPVAIQMHVTPRMPETMRHLVQHIGEGMSVKQVTAGNVLIGGGWPALRLDLDGRSVASVRSAGGNLALAARVLPFLSGVRLLRVWAGPLAATPDELPVIGEVPGAPGFFVAGGTYAFTLAPLWGETLCRLVAGESPRVQVSDLGPDRLLIDTQSDELDLVANQERALEGAVRDSVQQGSTRRKEQA